MLWYVESEGNQFQTTVGKIQERVTGDWCKERHVRRQQKATVVKESLAMVKESNGGTRRGIYEQTSGMSAGNRLGNNGATDGLRTWILVSS